MDQNFEDVEKNIDKWLPQKLYKDIPRYKYIYHCQCAFIDIMLNKGIFLSPVESFNTQFMFAFNYNIHLAYRHLKEDKEFEYTFDNKLYLYAYQMLLDGFNYAKLCDIFPRLYLGKASMIKKDDNISFSYDNIPRNKNREMTYYLFKKPFSYLIQIACGVSQIMEENQRQIFLSEIYRNYWGENLLNIDYEPYTAMEGGGIRSFLLFAAMKRFIFLYDNDFDLKRLRLTQLQILFSQTARNNLRSFIPTDNEEHFQTALEECIYKPLGNTDFPKANIADAPIIMTNNGCAFTNPIVILFNNSIDTQFLNCLRRYDPSRFFIIKNKIKERCIPQIQFLLNKKIKNIEDITNFEVKIPEKGKSKRELDYLAIDSNGIGLYIEFKHFYIPESVGEANVLDKEFNKAITKMPDQLLAIQKSWDVLRQNYKIPVDIKELHGMIVSYMFTGWDVPFDDCYPLINMSILSNAIEHSDSLLKVYEYCCNVEKAHKNIPTISKNKIINYAGYKFNVTDEVFDPDFEIKANKILEEQVRQKFIQGDTLYYVPYMSIDHQYILNLLNGNE